MALSGRPGAKLHHNDPARPPELSTESRGEADFVPKFVMATQKVRFLSRMAWFVVVCRLPPETALLPNSVLAELSAVESRRRWHLSSARLLH